MNRIAICLLLSYSAPGSRIVATYRTSALYSDVERPAVRSTSPQFFRAMGFVLTIAAYFLERSSG